MNSSVPRRTVELFLVLGALVLLTTACPQGPPDVRQTPKRPFPQHVTYAAGSIRPTIPTQAILDADVKAAYNRWKDNYLVRMGRNTPERYRVKFSKASNAPTVSEGQGYGMLIVVYMAGHDPEAQDLFDGLWRYFRDHPSRVDHRLMDWHVPANGAGEGDDDDSAFDGDADIAMGLLLADEQWGSDGDVDYKTEALAVMAGILASEIGPNSHLPLLGDFLDPSRVDPPNEYSPRSSDFLINHFRAFAAASGNNSWNAVVTACQSAIGQVQTDFSPVTGLLPDFLVARAGGGFQPAPPNFLEGLNDGAYSYNAVRDPWRIAIDALLTGNATSKLQAGRMTSWMESATMGMPQNITAGYSLAGAPLAGYNFYTSIFVAPFGVAAMSAGQQAWLNAIFADVQASEEEYYEDSVTLLCLIVMSGNWWAP